MSIENWIIIIRIKVMDMKTAFKIKMNIIMVILFATINVGKFLKLK